MCQPLQTPTFQGHFYFMMAFVDDHTKKMLGVIFHWKDEVFNKFKIFQRLVENESGYWLKTLKNDESRE
jgi:hypothetical protein